ncbi:MAG: efflux RND transporter periplasmic adaptor subunit [Alloprevotella sp.]
MKSRIATLLLGSLALVSCNNKNQMPAAGNEFAVITVENSTADLNTSYPATIKGQQDIEIRAKVSGHITQLLVDEGSVVRRGQTLFLIDDTQYRAGVNQAQANVNVVKANIATQELTVENKKMLFEKQIISDYDYKMAQNQLLSLRAQLEQAEAALQSARDQLKFCTVTSPADGIVGEIPYRVGSLVGASTVAPLTTVSNISKMYIYFSMTEKQLLALTRENGGVQKALAKLPAVNLKLADGTLYDLQGQIATASGVIDVKTGSVQIRADFANPNQVLRSGGTGSILVPVHQENAIQVPQKATFDIQDKKFVYVIDKDNKAQSTEISVLPQNDGTSYVVTSGLKAGDRIAVEGVNTIKNGMEIKPITPAQSAAKQKKAQQHMKDKKLPMED